AVARGARAEPPAAPPATNGAEPVSPRVVLALWWHALLASIAARAGALRATLVAATHGSASAWQRFALRQRVRALGVALKVACVALARLCAAATSNAHLRLTRGAADLRSRLQRLLAACARTARRTAGRV
ncbi:MAG: hypothetical protein ACHQ4H_11915, partial [Ktedonobacterales bacterium]